MLSATSNAAKYAQICPKLSITAKTCLKKISLKNFEIPPKIEIFWGFQETKSLLVEEAPMHVLTV
jgi:hypothetical protein